MKFYGAKPAIGNTLGEVDGRKIFLTEYSTNEDVFC